MTRRHKRRAVVGVTSSRGGGRYMWWFYWLAMWLFGIKPVRLVAPVKDLDLLSFDGLIIGGGDNISAAIYKGDTTLDVRIDPARDQLELALLRHSAEQQMPVLGVCRGAQMLNISYGGTLYQDMRMIYPDHPELWTPLPRKRVQLLDGTAIARLMRRKEMVVNSLHRQSISKVGDGLRVTGYDEYGSVQSIEDPASPFRIGVQWHPEFLIYQRAQRRLFEGFVQAVREYAKIRQEQRDTETSS